VFISYTDGAPGSDGYPDSRIFVVSKYSSAVNAVLQENSSRLPRQLRCRVIPSAAAIYKGGYGAKPGSGFANVDNLVSIARGMFGVSLICPLAHTMVSVPALPRLNKHRFQSGWRCSEGATSDLNVETSDLIGVLAITGCSSSHQWPGCEYRTLCLWPTPCCEMTGPTFVGIR